MYLPSPAFFYGLEVGESIEFEMPGANVVDAEKDFNADAAITKAVLTLNRVGPLEHDDMRSVEWELNGQTYVVKMQDTPPGKKKYDGPMADASNKTHVSSSLPGVVTSVAVAE